MVLLMIWASIMAARHLWSLYGLLFIDFNIDHENSEICFKQDMNTNALGCGVASATMDHTTTELFSPKTSTGSSNDGPGPSAAELKAVIVLLIALTVSEALALLTYKVINMLMERYSLATIPGRTEEENGNGGQQNQNNGQNQQLDVFYFPYFHVDERGSNEGFFRRRLTPEPKLAKIDKCLECYTVEHTLDKSQDGRLFALRPISEQNDAQTTARKKSAGEETMHVLRNITRLLDERSDSCAICLNDYGQCWMFL
jgi:hypothetical protein